MNVREVARVPQRYLIPVPDRLVRLLELGSLQDHDVWHVPARHLQPDELIFRLDGFPDGGDEPRHVRHRDPVDALDVVQADAVKGEPHVGLVGQDLRQDHHLLLVRTADTVVVLLHQVRGRVLEVAAPALQVLQREGLEEEAADDDEGRPHVVLAPWHELVQGLERHVDGHLLPLPQQTDGNRLAHVPRLEDGHHRQPLAQEHGAPVVGELSSVNLEEHIPGD